MAATRIHANQTPSQSPLHRMQGNTAICCIAPLSFTRWIRATPKAPFWRFQVWRKSRHVPSF